MADFKCVYKAATYTAAKSNMDDLENQLGELQNTARGVLRISAPVSFAISHLAKPLTEFQAQWPDVRIDLQLNDRKVDIIEEGFDIALRIGRLQSSSLIARHIAPIRLVTCASPDYLKQYGTPQSRAELKDHRYLHYSYATEDTILVPGAGLSGQLNSASQANNGDVLTQAAINGAGIVVLPTFIAGRPQLPLRRPFSFIQTTSVTVTRIIGETSGLLPFALRASLRLLNFVPDKMSMALSAHSASLQRRTGSVLFISASCRRINHSVMRLFRTDIIVRSKRRCSWDNPHLWARRHER